MSHDGLDRLFDELGERAAAEHPFVVELVGPTGARLGIGLGGRHSVLTFKASDDPPYFVSAGRGSSSGEETGFYYQGRWSEFDSGALVSADAARRAVHEFFSTGQKPTAVEWEEV